MSNLTNFISQQKPLEDNYWGHPYFSNIGANNMHLSFLTAIYYIAFILLGLVLGYHLGFNLFLLLCGLFSIANPPYWLNVLFAAGFAIILAIIYFVIAVLLHGIKNVLYKIGDAIAEFFTNLIVALYNKN